MTSGVDFEAARAATQELADDFRVERKWAVGLGLGAVVLATLAFIKMLNAKSIKAAAEAAYQSTGKDLPPHKKGAPPPVLE